MAMHRQASLGIHQRIHKRTKAVLLAKMQIEINTFLFQQPQLLTNINLLFILQKTQSILPNLVHANGNILLVYIRRTLNKDPLLAPFFLHSKLLWCAKYSKFTKNLKGMTFNSLATNFSYIFACIIIHFFSSCIVLFTVMYLFMRLVRSLTASARVFTLTGLLVCARTWKCESLSIYTFSANIE